MSDTPTAEPPTEEELALSDEMPEHEEGLDSPEVENADEVPA